MKAHWSVIDAEISIPVDLMWLTGTQEEALWLHRLRLQWRYVFLCWSWISNNKAEKRARWERPLSVTTTRRRSAGHLPEDMERTRNHAKSLSPHHDTTQTVVRTCSGWDIVVCRGLVSEMRSSSLGQPQSPDTARPERQWRTEGSPLAGWPGLQGKPDCSQRNGTGTWRLLLWHPRLKCPLWQGNLLC